MCRYILQSKSDGTVKKYYSYFNKWKLFCDKNGYDVMPAQPIHITLFLTELLDKCVTYCLISSIVYSIKWVHRINGENDPTENGFVPICLNLPNVYGLQKLLKKMLSYQICLLKIVSMIRKYHNHKPQTTPWHREEEPLNHHETSGRQVKQSNQLTLPRQDDCNTRMDIK